MSDLVFLAHRIPWPPNKGEKIRAWHLLQELSRDFRVHLGAFVDDPADWARRGEIAEACASTCFIYRHDRMARLRALPALAGRRPLTLPYYASSRLRRWVARRVADGAGHILTYSSAMAQYAEPYPQLLRVADFVDVDSAKWQTYAETARWPGAWVYSREARRLADYEARISAAFDLTTFVSSAEAAYFLERTPGVAERVEAVANGIDCQRYDPAGAGESPYPSDVQPLVFTGAMDYRPNVDAVCWFADAVLPAVRRRCPQARFYVVGMRPAPGVQALARRDGITVTGAVDDIRPWVWHAAAAVAPLRIARGVQNKVLEAMAAARPVVCTPHALAGIEASDGEHLVVASDADMFAARVSALLDAPAQAVALGRSARQFVLQHHDWQASGERLRGLIAERASARCLSTAQPMAQEARV